MVRWSSQELSLMWTAVYWLKSDYYKFMHKLKEYFEIYVNEVSTSSKIYFREMLKKM